MRLNDSNDDGDGVERYETRNLAGGTAYEAATAKKRLTIVVINNLLEGGYYHTDTDELRNVRDRLRGVADDDPEFVLKLARYARQEMNLRDVPLVLLVEAAHITATKPYVRQYTPEILRRADELLKAKAYHDQYVTPTGTRVSMPKPLRKGLRDALFTKTRYEITKYDSERGSVRFHDLLNVLRPDPTSEAARAGPADYERLFEQIIRGDLDEYPDVERPGTPDTRQSVLSDPSVELPIEEHEATDRSGPVTIAAGVTTAPNTLTVRVGVDRADERSVDDASVTVTVRDGVCAHEGVTKTVDEHGRAEFAFGDGSGLEWSDGGSILVTADVMAAAEKWRYLLDSDDGLPLQARVRNVVDMLSAGLDGEEIFGDVDEEWVRNSHLYPFRFWQAYDQIQAQEVYDEYAVEWLGDAVDVSAQALPDDLENTFVALDGSGSMCRPLAEGSSAERSDIAALFGAILAKKGAETIVFSNEVFELERVHHAEPTLALKDRISEIMPGNGTNAWAAIDHLRNGGAAYERVVVMGDEQFWDSTWGGERTVKDEWDAYKEDVAPDASLYVVNLADYGTLTMPEGYTDVYHVSGWTSKVLDHIEYADETDAVIREIETEWGLSADGQPTTATE